MNAAIYAHPAVVRPVPGRTTRIVAVGTLLAALALGWQVSGEAAKSSGPRASPATLGYNRAQGFFYGTARMPRAADGSGEFTCLEGNRHFPDGPRRMPRLPLAGGRAAEAPRCPVTASRRS